MAHVAVFGGGMVGALIAHDLATDHEVRLLDRSSQALATAAVRTPGLATAVFDAARDGWEAALHGCKVAVNCLPGALGHRALRAMLAEGVACADIAFAPEGALSLDDLARRKGVAAVVDCGVAPGLSNVLAAQLIDELGEAARLEIFVGGLPRDPASPWLYRAPFSPADVIEEYTRPARVVRRGRIIAVEPLSERRTMEVPGVGTLEAAVTDGLRTLLTLPVPEMAEYTLRWPGHFDRIVALRTAGLFGTAETTVDDGMVRVATELVGLALSPGRRIVPREAVAERLFAAWQSPPDEPAFTHLRVVATAPDGTAAGWVVHDDGGDGWSSMARTTGHTAAAFARMLCDGTIAAPGVHPPEAFGGDAVVTARLREALCGRGIALRRL